MDNVVKIAVHVLGLLLFPGPEAGADTPEAVGAKSYAVVAQASDATQASQAQLVAAQPKSVAIGTRLHWTDGAASNTDTVMKIEDGIAHLNEGARSYRLVGGFYPPLAHRYDSLSAPLKLFPMKVGSKTGFMTNANGSPFSHDLKVLRTERVTVNDTEVDTFVIEERIQVFSGAASGEPLVRTIWYAPELGVFLKLRTSGQYNARTQQRMPDRETRITKVQMPG